MKTALLVSVMMTAGFAFAEGRQGAYRCESRYDELLLNANVSLTTDGDLEIWFDDDSVELVDNSWFGPELEVTVKLADGSESTLTCQRR